MERNNIPKDELMGHVANAFERQGEQQALTELQSMSVVELHKMIGNAERTHNNKTHSELRQSRPVAARHNYIGRVLAVGAVAACMALIIGFQPKYSTTELYTSSYTVPVYEPEPPSRGGSIFDQTLFDNAIAHYQSGEYVSASKQFHVALQGIKLEEIPDRMAYYAAISFAQAEQTQEAVKLLLHLSTLDTSDFQEPAQWQLALLYLRDSKRSEARELLNNIVSEQGEYAEKAKALLSKIAKRWWF